LKPWDLERLTHAQLVGACRAVDDIIRKSKET